MSETWPDAWDDRIPTPPPLPSYPGRSEPPASDSGAASDSANAPRWSLVSLDGRATMRLPKRFVIGSGSCCDLCLSERGIAPHHAMLTVEEGAAFVTVLSDAASLLDGRAITGQQRLHRDASLTFGAATFRVEHEGLEEPQADGLAPVAEAVEAAPRTTPAQPPRATRHTSQTVPPHITPHVDHAARLDQRAAPPLHRRKRATRVSFAVIVLMAAAVWWVPRYTTGIPAFQAERLSTFAKALWSDVSAMARSDETETISAAEVVAPVVPAQPDRQVPDAAVMTSATLPAIAPQALPAPPPALPATPPSVREAKAIAATTTVLSEADALYASGRLIAPRGRNAAEHYVRVLRASPESAVARERLDQIVGRVAHDAGDMILRQRFDGARQALERLSAAIPQDQRSLVGKDALGQWRVVVLLLDADALMQQYRLVEPDDPNAVSLLNEALRIEPNNAIVDEMLSKAHGLLEERRKQAGVVVSALP